MCLVAGTVYGWPALRQQLQHDGTTLDESSLGAIYTVGAFSAQGARIIAGFARDRFGTRIVTAACILCVAIGAFGIGWSGHSNTVVLTISLFILGLGSGAQLCVQPVAGLFPGISGTIISSLSGAFQISGLVFLALTSVTSNRKASFTFYSACLVVLAIVSFFVLPKGTSFVPEPDDGTEKKSLEAKEDVQFGVDDTVELTNGFSSSLREISNALPPKEEAEQMQEEGSLHTEDKQETPADPEDCTKKVNEGESVEQTSDAVHSPSAMEQLRSWENILLCTWFSICLIPIQYYIGSIGFQLEDKGDDDGFYSDLFSILYAAASIVSPLGGYLADRFGLGFTQGLATAMLASSLVVLASDADLKVQVIGLAFYGSGTLFIFGMFFANLGIRFGYTHFGTLSGVSVFVSAIVSLIQYPLISLASDGKSKSVNLALAALLMSQQPYCMWLHRREKNDS